MRVITWNLEAGPGGWAGDLADRVRLLEQLEQQHGPWAVLCAQEVPINNFSRLWPAHHQQRESRRRLHGARP